MAPSRSSQQPANQQPGQSQTAKGQGPEGSRTKKGAWGGEAAGTDANVGVVSVREVAEPEGGAGAARIEEPRAAAQQPHLLFLRHLGQSRVGPLNGASIQQCLCRSTTSKPAAPFSLIGGDLAAVPLIGAPLRQLPVHLRQPPAVHQPKEADRYRPLAIGTFAACAIGVVAVDIRPGGVDRVAVVKGCA